MGGASCDVDADKAAAGLYTLTLNQQSVITTATMMDDMANKPKTITLSFPHYDNSKDGVRERSESPRVYQVVKVGESTEFNPGEQLSKAQVDELCAAAAWRVSLVEAK